MHPRPQSVSRNESSLVCVGVVRLDIWCTKKGCSISCAGRYTKGTIRRFPPPRRPKRPAGFCICAASSRVCCRGVKGRGRLPGLQGDRQGVNARGSRELQGKGQAIQHLEPVWGALYFYWIGIIVGLRSQRLDGGRTTLGDERYARCGRSDTRAHCHCAVGGCATDRTDI